MRKFAFVGFLLLLFLIIFYKLYHAKFNVDFQLAYTLNGSSEFYPMGYIFYHSEESMRNHFKMTKRDYLIENLQFDFKTYSYVMVCGKKVRSMYYGIETSKLHDISPDYSKTFNSIFIYIEYEDDLSGYGNTYIYKVEHNDRYRGLNGC